MIEPNQIWRSKMYGDEIRLIIHSVFPGQDIVAAYVHDSESVEHCHNIKNYFLSTFEAYFEIVE